MYGRSILLLRAVGTGHLRKAVYSDPLFILRGTLRHVVVSAVTERQGQVWNTAVLPQHCHSPREPCGSMSVCGAARRL
jgi:hypothetical protein